LAEIAERERARPAPPAAEDSFWAGVARLLEDPKQAAQDRADTALMDSMDAARAQAIRDDVNELSAWLRD